MSRVEERGQEIRKKLSLQEVIPSIQQESKLSGDKKKITVYLSQEAFKKFNEMCSRSILECGKADKSILICEAIELLHEKKNKS